MYPNGEIITITATYFVDQVFVLSESILHSWT